MDIITSRHNPTVKLLRRLASGRTRHDADPAYVEGILPLWRALDNNAQVRLIAYAPQLLRSEAAQDAVARVRDTGVACLAMSPEVFASFSRRENPVGLAGLVEAQWTPLDELETPNATTVVLHDIKDPGNLGAIFRTVDGIAGQGVVLLGQTADPYHPSSVRASVGTVFAVPVARAAGIPQLVDWCRAKGATLLATSAKADTALYDTQLSWPLAVLFGSEAQGLPPDLLAAADVTVSLPMYGQASSLNLAVAAGIVLYELRRRQGDGSPSSGQAAEGR